MSHYPPNPSLAVQFYNLDTRGSVEAARLLDELRDLSTPIGVRVDEVHALTASRAPPAWLTIKLSDMASAVLASASSKAKALSESIGRFSRDMKARHESWNGVGLHIEKDGVEHVLSIEDRTDYERLIRSVERLPAYWVAWGNVIPVLANKMIRIDWVLGREHWFPLGGWSRTPKCNEDFRDKRHLISEVERLLLRPPSVSVESPLKVLVAHAREDRDLHKDFEKHLRLLEVERLIEYWSIDWVGPGEDWKSAVERHMAEAAVFLPLVSVDFFQSEACNSIVLPYAMSCHARGKASVIPVILRPCLWQATSIKDLEVLPLSGVAVAMWPNIDQAFESVVTSLRRHIVGTTK